MPELSRSLTTSLIRAVQHNADVADARHAGGYTLCTYLMKMRDYYRWSEGEGLLESLDREALGQWIPGMEEHWDSLDEEGADYVDLPLPGGRVNCFDNRAINSVLNPAGLVYGGVHGIGGMPVFFLGRLEQWETADDPEKTQGNTASLDVLVCGEELARSMSAPPALSAPGMIFVRRDALRRYLAGMVEEWGWKREDNAMGRVVAHYGFDQSPGSALECLVDAEMENVILHEIGERVAGALIGNGWQALLRRMENPLLEMKIRAVRDNLADCLASLPACITLENWPSVDFYYASMTPMRRELFPGFCEAYQAARGSGDYRSLAPLVSRAREHWLRVSRALPDCTPAALEGFLGRSAF
jgi:hypothetical protein